MPPDGASGVVVLPSQVGVRYSLYERLPILMEIGQTALPRTLIALVSRAVKKRGYVSDSENVRTISIHTMPAAFHTLPQQMLRLHATVEPTDLGSGVLYQPLVYPRHNRQVGVWNHEVQPTHASRWG